MPTPIPPMNLAITNSVKDRGRAERMAETVKRTAHRIRTFFLPVQSAIGPASNAPITQATIRLLTAKPSWYAFKLNSIFIKCIAPDMTPVSNPNNRPPRAAAVEKISS